MLLAAPSWRCSSPPARSPARRRAPSGHAPAEGRADRAERPQRPRVHAVDVRALKPLQAKYNFKLSVSENQFVVADAANIMRQYAAEGYNLIIAHGSQYGGHDPAARAEVPEGLVRLGHGELDVRPAERLRLPGRLERGRLRAGLHGRAAQQDEGDRRDRARSRSVTRSSTSTGSRPARWPRIPKATVHVSYTGSFSDPSLMSKQATRVPRREGGRPDRQLAVRRRRDHRRQGEQRRVVRDAVDAGLACAEAGRVLPGLRLDRHPRPRSSTASRPASSAAASYTITSRTAARRSSTTRATPSRPSVKAKAQKVIAGIENGSIKVPEVSDGRCLSTDEPIEATTPGSAPDDAGAPLLEMRGITKRFPGVVADDRVDFDVRRGRGAHAVRRERRRQEHADARALRPLQAGRGRDPAERRSRSRSPRRPMRSRTGSG